ncbi:hypothetical protein RUM43_003593 [Polyplax serrata]|uniref:Uncharacterized protein n=1 Tax=Polyplax serrata TaxID=468196 RepID=A0AAN8NX05_POLSC
MICQSSLEVGLLLVWSAWFAGEIFIEVTSDLTPFPSHLALLDMYNVCLEHPSYLLKVEEEEQVSVKPKMKMALLAQGT